MTNKEASILFSFLVNAKNRYETEKHVPVTDSMPGCLAFEQGYIAGFQACLECTEELKSALRSLINDAHSGDDNLWRIGPYADTTESRLGFAKQALEKFE